MRVAESFANYRSTVSLVQVGTTTMRGDLTFAAGKAETTEPRSRSVLAGLHKISYGTGG
jgi:hypothetical protein